MDEEKGEMAESDDDAAMETPCKFSVSGSTMHTYRSWHSWDLAGTVNLGEASMDFAIEDAAPAMVVEPEPEPEADKAS